MYYNSLNQNLRNRFGCKVYKLSISAGLTCPNRDGTCGTKGCIFCSTGGSGEFASDQKLNIKDQIEQAKLKICDKTASQRYIAYFQSYTNTYAEITYLEKIFTEAIRLPQVVALSIATRPDCLPDNVIELLDRLNKIKPVFLELGLQTIHSKTARYIRRGYELACFEQAVKKLKAINLNVVVHVILGLPFETRDEMLKTVEYVGRSGADGIKLQLLHVLKHTDLAIDYDKGLFEVLDMDSYSDLLCDCVELLPPEMVIHRLTGDGAKSILIAPLWSGDKKKVLNTINKKFRERDITQGSKFKPY